jgi:hypothetical protein
MRWLLFPLLLVAFAAAPAGASAACKNLRVPDHVRTALKEAHGHRDGAISKGSIYYGRCGRTRYAIASFSKALADQPEKFIKRRGHHWKDKGDGFENGCDRGARYPIPKALVKLWHVCPSF